MEPLRLFNYTICQDMERRSRWRFMTVRFGNVLGDEAAGAVLARVVPDWQREVLATRHLLGAIRWRSDPCPRPDVAKSRIVTSDPIGCT